MALIFLLLSAIVSATNDKHGHSVKSPRCGTHQHMQIALAQNATWQQRLDAANREWRNYTTSSAKTTNPSNIEISVVWHAIIRPKDRLHFVPDEVIAYQINVLNQDYNGKNSDFLTNTPSEFRSVQCQSSGVTFKINRVIRKYYHDDYFNGSSDDIKYTEKGGSDVVSPDQNLNIWTGPMLWDNPDDEENGWSSYPGAPPEIDGVVLEPLILSPLMGNFYAPDNQGRTGTHEVGHWLGLLHIWGDSEDCLNDMHHADYVIDTPAHSAPNYECDIDKREVRKTCNDTFANPYSQDMYMNFMDYTHDVCMSMFTIGQCERIWFMLRRFRMGLFPRENVREMADRSYVSWLYFRRFEGDHIDVDDICFGEDHVLFYDYNLNKESKSNISVYGCLVKTENLRISHITDIKVVYGDEDEVECGDGYTQSSQDLNEGNDGDSIYLCYFKEDHDFDGGISEEAILDITLIENANSSKLNMERGWRVNMQDDINPNGVSLNIAIKEGVYYATKDAKNGAISCGNIIVIGCILLCSLLVVIKISFIIRKRQKRVTENRLLRDENEYGATTELQILEISEEIYEQIQKH